MNGVTSRVGSQSTLSGWHSIDLDEAVPHPGDTLTVALQGVPLTILRDGEGEVRALRRGPGQFVRCVVRCGVIFVNLSEEDRLLVDVAKDLPAPHCA
jgi:phenylpropionate dioxygenase-like ring-hydroxylating dioxygenase large terminal subunit